MFTQTRFLLDLQDARVDTNARHFYILHWQLRSQYNWLDLLAFISPLIASKIQLDNIGEDVPVRAGWLLSFSLIIVFLHLVKRKLPIILL